MNVTKPPLFSKRLISFGKKSIFIFLISFPLFAEPTSDADIPIFELIANPLDNGRTFECMANAYLTAEGKGLKSDPESSLNCTANDVEITEVEPQGVVVRGVEDKEAPFTCIKGELFTLIADVTVKTNADRRYDTTFYLPLNELSPQVVQENSSCAIILPSSIENKPAPPFRFDGDNCGDIDKTGLELDQYIIDNARFTMLCDSSNTSPTNNEVEFEYCAAWSVKDRLDCTGDPDDTDFLIAGQVPSQTSKCNCDSFPIPVFFEPKPPVITKTREMPDNRDESGGIFDYAVNIKRAANDQSDKVILTALDEFIQVVGDPDLDNSIGQLITFDLFTTPACDFTDPEPDPITYNDISNCTNFSSPSFDGIYLIKNTCYDKTDSDKELTNDEELSCEFSLFINDDDLLDDPTPNDNSSPQEVYKDFVRYSAEDVNGDEVGDDTCNRFFPPADVENNNCSSIVPIYINNVDPDVSITKLPVLGDSNAIARGLRNEEGEYYLDNANGPVTYEITITNPSKSPNSNNTLIDRVDPIWFTEFFDYGEDPTLTSNDKIDLLSNCTPSGDSVGVPMPVDESTALPVGGIFTCRYQDTPDVDNDDDTANPDNIYTNYVEIVIQDNESRVADDNDFATVKLGNPMISLTKEVLGPDDTEFSSATTVPELGIDDARIVIYKFEITNTRSDGSDAPLYITAIKDYELFGNNTPTDPDQLASAAITTLPNEYSPECSASYSGTNRPKITKEGIPTDKFTCYVAAVISGQPEQVLVNTAYADAETSSNTPVEPAGPAMATVTIYDVPPTIDVGFALGARVFISYENTSDEDIYLSGIFVLNTPVLNGKTISRPLGCETNTEVECTSMFTIKTDSGPVMFSGSSVSSCVNPTVETSGDIVYPNDLLILEPDDPPGTCFFDVLFTPGYEPVDFGQFSADAATVNSDKVTIEFKDEEGTSVSARARAKVITKDFDN